MSRQHLGNAEDPSRTNFTVLNQSGVPTHARAVPGRGHAQGHRVTVLRWACGPRRRPLSPDSGTPRGTERCATVAARLTMAPTVLGQWGGASHRAMCHGGRAVHDGDPLSSGSGTPRGTERCATAAVRLTMAPTVLGQWGGASHRATCHGGRAVHGGNPLSSGSGTPRGYGPRYGYTKLRESCSEYVLFTWSYLCANMNGKV